jgi:hypothetical protein
MIYSVTLSKPVKNIESILGQPYKRVKIKLSTSSHADGTEGDFYMAEFFTEKQTFHKKLSASELDEFLQAHEGKTFLSCVERTEDSEITILANKKGKITRLTKTLSSQNVQAPKTQIPGVKLLNTQNRKKNYIISKGTPVPFLVRLGIMTADGKVISSKYDKFRQINRYLEFIDDILSDVVELKKADGDSEPLKIIDFGSGKSYLTFAVQYFLTDIKKIPCRIEGLDLKQDVIEYCSRLAGELKLSNLSFSTGNIADYSKKIIPDIVITLHACDTATDFALKYAVQNRARAILSVPCCQHQVLSELKDCKKDSSIPVEFEPLLKWGIIKEKFASLVTDSLRATWLEQQNYKVQLLEFIDIEHTPKNILIRAVKKNGGDKKNSGAPELLNALKINPEIFK